MIFFFPCWFWLKAIRLLRLWINFTVHLPRTLMFSTIRELDLTRKITFLSHSDSSSNFNINSNSSTIKSHFVLALLIFVLGFYCSCSFLLECFWKDPQRNWLFRWPCPLIFQEISLSAVSEQKDPPKGEMWNHAEHIISWQSMKDIGFRVSWFLIVNVYRS